MGWAMNDSLLVAEMRRIRARPDNCPESNALLDAAIAAQERAEQATETALGGATGSADLVDQLRDLAWHLRYCRECAEMDVEKCTEGWRLWLGCMPPAPNAPGSATTEVGR